MKIIKVIGCWDCPHKYKSVQGTFVGCKLKPLTIIKKSLKIPTWCPLPDLEEEK